MKSLAFALCIATLALSLSACGSDKENVNAATKICNDALRQGGGGDDGAGLVQREKKNADRASRLAEEDEKWSDLADAISAAAAAGEESINAALEMLQDDSDSTLYMERSQEALNDFRDAKRGVVTQCRKVKAAGGKVSQSLLDSYIK